MDWFSAFIGTLLLRTMVGGSALLGVFYLWIGHYAFAAGILLPLVGIMVWMAMDLQATPIDDVEWDR